MWLQCVMQCIFNQTRVIINNAFSRDAALILYAKYFPEVPLDLLTASVDTCIAQVQNLPSNRTNRTRNTQNRCWNAPGVFAACFAQEVYAQCPDAIRNTSESFWFCARWKNLIEFGCFPLCPTNRRWLRRTKGFHRPMFAQQLMGTITKITMPNNLGIEPTTNTEHDHEILCNRNVTIN